MFLSRQQKRSIEAVARDNWRMAKAAYTLSPKEAHKFARMWTESDIVLRSKGLGFKSYSSIISSILISLAVKFAIKLLVRWLLEEFNERPEK